MAVAVGRRWETLALGNLAEFRNGINYNKDNFGRGIKVINVKDFQDYSIASFENLDEVNLSGVIKEKDLLRAGDIIFVRSNGNRELIGRSLFIKNIQESVTHSAFTIKLRFTSNQVIPRFYAYLFRSSLMRQTFSVYGNGTNISNLNQGILSNLEVPLPPLPIQRKIAGILSAYDDLIENNTRRIEILEEMARSIYREWFVKFRFPGHEQVQMVDSELGLIPEGWEIKPVEELLSYHIGGGWGEEEQSNQYPAVAYVIRGTDIPLARLVSVVNCPLRFHKQSNFNSRKLELGDIVFEVSGGSKGQPVGRALLITQKLLKAFDSDVICASFCKLLRVNNKVILPELLYLHLLDIYSNGRIDKYQVQSTGITNFKFAFFLESEQLLVPPPQWQAKFNKIAISIFESIQTLGAKNANLRQTRDLLLPRLITGEIDVENLDINTGPIAA